MAQIRSYQMVSKDQPFEEMNDPFPEIGSGDALVKVAGCGMCHTDLSFWHYGVPTRHPLPLTLGHEISGIVVEGAAELQGKPVIVPAVLPCGECALCHQGRGNICRDQKMPGNDFHGGFASHVIVPERYLVLVPEEVFSENSLEQLAVIADAVSTPYQAITKSNLQKDDFALIIGVGGIGIYAAQLAHVSGAKVLAIDVSQERLDNLSEVGITSSLNTNNMGIKEIKGRVREIARSINAPDYGWKIFEMSGTRAGQELAYALLGVAGTLSIVGFTLEKFELRLSNLMAFDAQVIGTWGCKPELYPDVINLVADGKIKIAPFVESVPMSRINEVFQQSLEHTLTKRPILIPDFGDQ